jgi:hypothetical protein
MSNGRHNLGRRPRCCHIGIKDQAPAIGGRWIAKRGIFDQSQAEREMGEENMLHYQLGSRLTEASEFSGLFHGDS